MLKMRQIILNIYLTAHVSPSVLCNFSLTWLFNLFSFLLNELLSAKLGQLFWKKPKKHRCRPVSEAKLTSEQCVHTERMSKNTSLFKASIFDCGCTKRLLISQLCTSGLIKIENQNSRVCEFGYPLLIKPHKPFSFWFSLVNSNFVTVPQWH